MAPGKFQGSTRGIFGLKTWQIPRMPFDVHLLGEPIITPSTDLPRDWDGTASVRPNMGTQGNLPMQKVAPQPRQDTVQTGTILVAKYSYKANKDSPLGVELALTPGDKVKFQECHQNDNWWLVEDRFGQIGYVPGSYLVNMDTLTTLTSLPWLPSKAEKPEEERVTVEKKYYKKYVSTYEHQEIKQMKMKEFYCDVCDKQLNGPQPYRAHMNSKAHKETVEYYEEGENNQ